MKKEITIDAQYAQMRLDRFVGKVFSELTRARIQRIIRQGDVRVNGKKAPAEYHLCEGDVLKIYLPEPESVPKADKVPKLAPLPIVYEDEQLLAVQKPAGLLTHPDGSHTDSVSERILSYLYADCESLPMFRAAPLNRLDYNTSGIVLSGKTPQYSKLLAELMRRGKIKKRYLVLVGGELQKARTYSCYAEKDTRENKMRLYEQPAEGRVLMSSVFTPLEYHAGKTLVSAQLITGRTHQLRAQLAYLGLPVIGDRKYGSERLNYEAEKLGLSRQFLHCCEMRIITDFDTLALYCAPSADLRDYLCRLNFNYDMQKKFEETEENPNA